MIRTEIFQGFADDDLARHKFDVCRDCFADDVEFLLGAASSTAVCPDQVDLRNGVVHARRHRVVNGATRKGNDHRCDDQGFSLPDDVEESSDRREDIRLVSGHRWFSEGRQMFEVVLAHVTLHFSLFTSAAGGLVVRPAMLLRCRRGSYRSGLKLLVTPIRMICRASRRTVAGVCST